MQVLEPDDTSEVVAPPVVAVLVASDPGPGLDDALASLAAQDYPALSVLVLDNASADDPTPRIAAALPSAFVRRLPENLGFAGAANEVIGSVEGATFLLFCHDDVAFDDDAVRLLVEEAYRSNAGIVGPKLVVHERPDELLEVGLTIDHYGVAYTGIEPGELDQEQHDAVRDVFFVSHAAMLVRADLFQELGGYDAATGPGSDDLDLCWRARLAGARVVVAPDARVRHRRASLHEPTRLIPAEGPLTRELTAARVRTLCKSYSGVALLWVVPVAFALSVAEAIALASTGRWARARGVLGGWWANLRGAREVWTARRLVQGARRVPDADVRDLMLRGSARVRTYFGHRLHAGDRLQIVSARTRVALDSAGSRVRSPELVVMAILALVLGIGSRALVTGGVTEVTGFLEWGGWHELVRTSTSPWRFAGLGADVPAPAGFGVLVAWVTVFLGDADVARTVLVVGAIPVGAWGAGRVARPFAPSLSPALAASVAYAVNPIARDAIAGGRLGPLVTYALAPHLLVALLRAGTAAPVGLARIRPFVVVAALTALMAAVWPPALLLAPLVAAAFALAAPLVGGWRLVLGTTRAALVAFAGGFVLLVPGALGLVGADGATLGRLPGEPLTLGELVRFDTGASGAAWTGLGLLVAAALPLLVATGVRLAWTGRAVALVLVSFALTWVPMRVDRDLAVPASEGVLVPAAVGVAILVGLGVAAFVEDLRRFHFGWRQLASVVAAVGLLVAVASLSGDAIDGRWGLPARSWDEALGWTEHDVSDEGAFRVLWLGDARVLPGDARVADSVGWSLTRNGGGDVRDLWAPSGGAATDTLEQAIGLATTNRTAHLGRLLAPAGVRFVAVIERTGPDADERLAAPAGTTRGLVEQVDLALVQSEGGIRLYENVAWAPLRAVVDSAVALPDDPDAIDAALRADLSDAAAVRGSLGGSDAAGPGTLLFAESQHDGWSAHLDGERVERARGVPGTNAFVLTDRGSVALRFSGGAWRYLLATQALLWLAIGIVLVRTRRRRGVR
ncbi:MAG TPA: glycosyltransferase [Acidimicrobiia bacterium]|nr:glycosyltransferase [Acidimicrobiia bacterium]